MPITPKDLLSTVVEQGRKVVSGATGRFRRDADASEPTSAAVVTPLPAPRLGGTKTGASTPASTRTQRAKASGTSERKPATTTAAKASKAKTAAAKSKASAATTPGSARPQAGTSRSTPKPAGDGASATSSAAKDTAPAGDQKSS